MGQNIKSTQARETTARRDREMVECERWRKKINQDFLRHQAELAAVLPPGWDGAFAGEPAVEINPWI
jgi:hypothetical protein